MLYFRNGLYLIILSYILGHITVSFILLFNLTGYAGIASSEIVPLKKPIQTKEETQKKLLIDVLKPLPKPLYDVPFQSLEKLSKLAFSQRRKMLKKSLKKIDGTRILKEFKDNNMLSI